MKKFRYVFVLYLSAIPPLTIVVAVVANDSWNRKVVNTGPTAKPSAFTNLKKKNM